jgi:C4-dicarboxylate-specific signal transduction histidine kinase
MFKKINILYVEDEEILLTTIQQSLQPIFHSIIIASNGSEGLELFLKNQNTIDIIITDINMPYMNGLEMCEAIREINKTIPIIITTAFNDIDFLHKAIELNVAHFVLKPIMIPKLLQVIESAIEPKLLAKELDIERKINEEEKVKNGKILAIKNLTSGITHELNTPLTFIKGTLEIMEYDLEDIKENDELKTSLQQNLKKVNGGLTRIQNIINTMKDLYDDCTVEDKIQTNIYDTIIDAVILSYNKLKHISRLYINGELYGLESEKAKYQFYVNVQKHRIEHLWIILIHNALDELAKIEDFEQRQLDITINENEQYVIVQVQDNAGGIDEEIIEHIYEPFKGTKPSSGMGIGLTIAKKIVEENDAYIVAKNNQDGALFEVGIKKS